MSTLLVILASVALVSLIAFTGLLFISLKEAFLKRTLMILVSFASGSLIGGAFIHLLPEALEQSGPNVFYYVVAGIMLFFIMEKFLYWRHCHNGTCSVHTFAFLNLIGDGIHNFIDGMIIASSYLHSHDLGVATTLAVIFHEIPQEIGDFGVLVYGGLSKRKALTYNFLSALTAIAGALVTYHLALIQSIEQWLIPIAAGGFIYIAGTDLMPELHKQFQLKDSVTQLVTILAGITLMSALKIFLS
ncbi:MAG: ZIP family metal transporter [Candidatus Bathyarchaeota archaeon]|nr:ZIP family metal transporter [Candidatus Bathyarchaeota archaeon]MCZ2808456.1 ZIP family metal transporter [Candidatus Bathyarchaeota archaeon]